MEIIEAIKANWILIGFALLVVVGILGGPRKVWELLKGLIPAMPAIGDGAPDGKDAFDAAALLCEFLPDDAAKELCTLVSPYLLTEHHED